MNTNKRPHRRMARLCVAAVALLAGTAAAEEVPRQDITAVPVARSFNLVGIGAGTIPEFSGSRDQRLLILPIIRADYRDRVYINALQAGAWLWDAEDKRVRVGLAIEPRFGWQASDGTRVEGMERREFSLEGGPNVQVRTGFGVFYASMYQDLSGASNGQSAQLQFIRAIRSSAALSPRLRLNASVGLQWISARTNDYYFGVRPQEARPDRPAYQAGAGTNLQAGINGVYLMERSSILFGVIGSWLNDAVADSPIVETRFQPVVYVGFGVNF
jgi:outer membrane protein